MTDTNKLPSNINRSALYRDMSHLRSLPSAQAPIEDDDELDGLISMKSYLKWVGVLSIVSLLIGFCTAAITQ
jgi:hypothetical protein